MKETVGSRQKAEGRFRPELWAEATWDCNTCGFWRSRNNRRAGVLIPKGQKGWGYGECLRPEGHCQPRVTRNGIE